MSTETVCVPADSPVGAARAAVEAARPARSWNVLARWLRAWRERRLRRADHQCVVQMDDHLLSDIGASAGLREQAAIERNRNARSGWDLHIW